MDAARGAERAGSANGAGGPVAQVEAWARTLGPRLYRAAHYWTGDGHEAEELCQETFAAALEGGFRGASAPYTWLFGILRNLFRERRKKRRPTFAPELPEDARGRSPPPEPPLALAEAAEAKDRVREAVMGLPDDQRDIVLLRYMDEASIDEIAAALGLPGGTVKSRLFAARAKLRAVLGRAGLGDDQEERLAG